MLTLTRYLYPKEFVVLSFYNSMSSKKELNECLFWIYELYYSGFINDIFDAFTTALKSKSIFSPFELQGEHIQYQCQIIF